MNSTDESVRGSDSNEELSDGAADLDPGETATDRRESDHTPPPIQAEGTCTEFHRCKKTY